MARHIVVDFPYGLYISPFLSLDMGSRLHHPPLPLILSKDPNTPLRQGLFLDVIIKYCVNIIPGN
jgi:hypothetical protein